MHTITIPAIARKELVTNRAVISFTGIAIFILLTWLGAYIYIPLQGTPVPITMQTLFVFLSGALLGRKSGPLSQAAYTLLGLTGMPIFIAGGFGILHLLGPTGGYILGFTAASYIIGRILSRQDNIISIITAFTAGAAVIFTLGAGWLAFGLGLGIKKALYAGVLPFLPGCLIKMAIATVITKTCIRRAKELFY